MLRWAMAVVVGMALTAPVWAAGISVERLRCEYRRNPLGPWSRDPVVIDITTPRLSWVVDSDDVGARQTAYQILVASSRERLDQDQGDLWDSGRVAGDQSIQVPYAGRPLTSGQACWWKVRVWDAAGKPSEWSLSAGWSMGLLNRTDWKAKWIGMPGQKDTVGPLFRKGFSVDKPVRRAMIYATGVGFFELHLNGEKVGDHELDPGFTRYDRRVLYCGFDVTRQLRQGANAIGMMLGDGWYNYSVKAAWDFDKAPWRGKPETIVQLVIEYTDGTTQTVLSDSTWKSTPGPVVFNAMMNGETYDARQEKPGWDAPGYNDAAWQSAEEVAGPRGVLSAMNEPAVKVIDTLTPVSVSEPKPGVFVFDVGRNIAGIGQLTVSGPAGTTVEMRYGEVLNPDGTLNQADIAQHTHQGDFQTDRYILKGQGTEVWQGRFMYHGYQYVQVTGFPGKPTVDSLRALVLHAAFDPAGKFECSNELLNRIQEATRRAYVSNFYSIPTDCPHREKNGWTGDAHLAVQTGLFNYDSAANYTKWIQDIQDEQRPSGELPGIVPTGGWGYAWGNGPAWDSAYLLIPWAMHEFDGDQRILAHHYDNFKRYVDYLTGKSKGGIVSIGLGDWAPFKSQTPTEVTSTAYYYRDVLVVAKTARMLGKTDDAEKYDALAKTIREAFNKRFYHADTGSYANNTQTANACAIYSGLADAEQAKKASVHLAADVQTKGNHLDCGILGTKYLLHALADTGHADLAYKVITQTDIPSWGYWITKRHATTLWEEWDDAPGKKFSRNHIMFGDISAWCYETLAGIQPDPEHPGFKHFFIRPQLLGDLKWVKAEHASLYGTIRLNWTRQDGRLMLDVTVPANSTATVSVPAGQTASVKVGGKPADQAPGVTPAGRQDGAAIFNLESGSYRFEVQ